MHIRSIRLASKVGICHFFLSLCMCTATGAEKNTHIKNIKWNQCTLLSCIVKTHPAFTEFAIYLCFAFVYKCMRMRMRM